MTDSSLTDRIEKVIGPTMLLGLQDAELHDEPGTQRIREWVTWIAGAIAPIVTTEAEAELERIRAAVTEGKYRDLGRPLTTSDIQVAHDITRKALAEALDAGLHLNWSQLVAEAQRCHAANAAWKADVDRVRELHVRNRHTGSCEHCSAGDYPDYDVPWPCPTIEALNGRES
ncbi:hypothetical protein ACFVWR_18305 [Leifsonia sp. NPDC058292]|uniref:hypothetical protein n=1 Tax=Leifsonia sp. NPDC058292 TaxID=3346428 RepID=UPI0036D7AF4E